jgi:hypothetical protein
MRDPSSPKNLNHVADPERLIPWPLILAKRVHLARGDLVALDAVRLGMEARMSLMKALAISMGRSSGLLGMARR